MWQYFWKSEDASLFFILIPLAILDIILKALSLWRAARNGQKGWFVALLLVNSLGILPGIYLYLNKEKKSKKNN